MPNWIIQNGQMLAFLAQLFYWIAMPILVAYAVVQYKRWVNYQLGTGRSGQLRHAEESAKSEPAVSVDEFVE